MSTLTTRAGKGSSLTNAEIDANFNNLNNDKLETSVYTAADVLAKLLTVDGAASGLDADLLDGQSSAYYTDIPSRLGFTPLNAATYTAADVLAKLLTVDGHLSNLDADTVDGVQLTGLVQTSRNINTGVGSGLTGGGTLATDRSLAFDTTWGDARYLLTTAYTANDILTKLLTVDGAGSSLDADNLDGQSGAYYADIPARLGYTPVTNARTITAGTGLSGGTQDLTANRTISFDTTWGDARYALAGHTHSFLGLAGGTLTGSLTVKSGATGYIKVTSGDASYPGYIEMYTANDIRRGYIGYGNASNQNLLVAANGWTWKVEGAVAFDSDISLGFSGTKSYFVYDSSHGMGTPDLNGLQIFTGSSIRFGTRVAGVFTDKATLDSNGNLVVVGSITSGGVAVSLSNHNHSGVYANASHAHAISDVTGLQTALDGKSATSHNHAGVYADAGHTHAAYAALTGASFSGNISSSTQIAAVGAGQSRLEAGGDIWAIRSGGTTGVIYFGNSGGRYLYYDAVNYTLAGAGLYTGGSIVSGGNVHTANNSGNYLYSYGNVYAQGDVIAYYSDERLKNRLGNISNALDKVCSLDGFRYQLNDIGQLLMKREDDIEVHVGVSAQQVQRVVPEAVTLAPFDMDEEHGGSKSGSNYLTVKYERLVPLLIEAIKELNAKVERLQ